jgi:hypothetical protein
MPRLLPLLLVAGLLLCHAAHAGFVPHRPAPPPPPPPSALAKARQGVAGSVGAVGNVLKKAGRKTQQTWRRLASQRPAPGQVVPAPPLAGDRPTLY